MKLATS